MSVYARRLEVPRHPTNVIVKLSSVHLSTQLPAPVNYSDYTLNFQALVFYSLPNCLTASCVVSVRVVSSGGFVGSVF